jgi:two-component system cell cycle sensor histidine kinase/response regulator CckA
MSGSSPLDPAIPYSVIFDHHPLPAWVYDTSSLAFLAVNRAAVSEYGYSEQEFLDMRITAIRSEEDAQFLLRFLAGPLQSDITSGPWRHKRKDGSLLLATIYSFDITYKGRRARLILVKNISEQKKLEQQLRLFAAAVEDASEAVMITDAHLEAPGPRIVFVNAAFTSMTGYTPEEVIGRVPNFLRGAKTEHITLDRIHRDLAATGTTGYSSINYRKDGTEYMVEWQVTPLKDDSGAITHYLSIQRDVTERNRLLEQFNQAQKMEAVGRLAGGIAHDFNNLLTIILGYTGLLTSEFSKLKLGDTKLARSVEGIQQASEKAAALTTQLLAFSRKQVLRTRIVDLNPFVANLEGLLRRLIGEDINMDFRPGPNLARVQVDTNQFEQALMNLAVNARDAMPNGGMLTVETRNAEVSTRYAALTSVKPGKYVLISVTDDGSGMDEETRSRIFEPFFTTKEPGRGTGLGLAMVYGFAKQNGGTITVYSEPLRGTCFKMYLPATEGAEEELNGAAVSIRARGSGVVLIVEDDIGIRGLIGEVLAEEGYEVILAADAKEAMERSNAFKGPIHLLLTDVVLPGMSGPDLAEQLKAIRPEIKVLFASGYSDHALLRQGAIASGAAFVPKPFDAGTLLYRVSDLLLNVATLTPNR